MPCSSHRSRRPRREQPERGLGRTRSWRFFAAACRSSGRRLPRRLLQASVFLSQTSTRRCWHSNQKAPSCAGLSRQASRALEWCDRRLLARIHRYTLNRLRAEIAPVSPAEFMRFLFAWQHVEPSSRLSGPEGLRAVLAQLDGLELPARAWERDVLPARLERYEPSMLDMLCLSGEVGWARLSSGPSQVVGATPIALFLREHADEWWALRGTGDAHPEPMPRVERTPLAGSSIACSRTEHRSCRSLKAACDLTDDACREALAELVAAGLVASDGFAGVRAIVSQAPPRRGGAGHGRAMVGAATGHRLSRARTRCARSPGHCSRRYGVVFRRVLARETSGCALARPGARVSDPRGTRRDPRRAIRVRNVGRAVRAAGCRRSPAGASPIGSGRHADHHQRGRPIEPDRHHHRPASVSAPPPATASSTATACLWRRWKATCCEHLLRSTPSIAADVAAAAAGRRVPVLSGFVGRLG